MRFGGAPPITVEDDERIDAETARRVLRRTAAMLRPYRRSVVLATIVMLGATGALLAGPALVRYGIDHGLRRRDGGALDLAALAFLGVAIAAVALTITMLARTTERR